MRILESGGRAFQGGAGRRLRLPPRPREARPHVRGRRLRPVAAGAAAGSAPPAARRAQVRRCDQSVAATGTGAAQRGKRPHQPRGVVRGAGIGARGLPRSAQQLFATGCDLRHILVICVGWVVTSSQQIPILRQFTRRFQPLPASEKRVWTPGVFEFAVAAVLFCCCSGHVLFLIQIYFDLMGLYSSSHHRQGS